MRFKKRSYSFNENILCNSNQKQELSEKDYSELTENEKRFYQRNLTRKGNYSLNITARNAGAKNFIKLT